MESINALGTARVRVADELTQWIRSGRLVSGSVLPSERQLAVLLGASQPSVHRGLAQLEASGLVVAGVGRERRVRAMRSPLMTHVLVVLATWHRAKHQRTTGFTDHITEAAHEAAAGSRWHALAAHPGRFDAEMLDGLIAQRPAAIVLPEITHLPGDHASAIRQLRQAGIAVAVNARGASIADADSAVADHAAGASLLVTYAAERGRRRILPIWTSEAAAGWWYAERTSGIRRGAAATGLRVAPDLVVTLGQIAGDPWGGPEAVLVAFAAAAAAWAAHLAPVFASREAPDALLVHTDIDAAAVGAACRLLGREPGRDVDVFGFDAYLADLPLRPLAEGLIQASVDRDNPAIGRALVELAIARSEGTSADEPQLRLIRPTLITTF